MYNIYIYIVVEYIVHIVHKIVLCFDCKLSFSCLVTYICVVPHR